jgi:hypothetical protein
MTLIWKLFVMLGKTLVKRVIILKIVKKKTLLMALMRKTLNLLGTIHPLLPLLALQALLLALLPHFHYTTLNLFALQLSDPQALTPFNNLRP